MSRKELAETDRAFQRHYPDINATDAEIEDFLVDVTEQGDSMDPTWQQIGADVWTYGDWMLVNVDLPLRRGSKREEWQAYHKGKREARVLRVALDTMKGTIEMLVEHDLNLEAMDVLDKLAEAR